MITKEAIQKGKVAEQIVQEYLESKDYIIYCPKQKDKSHCFDLVFSHGKNAVFIADVKMKTNCIRLKGKEGLFTGIPVSQHSQYLNFIQKTGCKFYLIFVDLQDSMVYQAEMIKLTNPEFVSNGKTIVWNRNQMKLLFELNFDQIQRLKNLDDAEV